jgi:hypothetical protein
MIMKPWKRVYIFPCISKRWAGFALACVLSACRSVPEPGLSHVRYAEEHGYVTTLADLQAGRRLTILKCTGCHRLPRLLGRRLTPETWPGIMDTMRVKAKLSARQDSLIRTFVLVAAGQLQDSLAAAKAVK